jgi:hypothetical protein
MSFTVYNIGDKVFPSVRDGFYYEATQAGTSGATEPAFDSYQDAETIDSNVIWKAIPDSTPGEGKNWTTFWIKRGTSGSPYAQNTDYRAAHQFDIENEVLEISNVILRYALNDHKVTLISREVYQSIFDKTDVDTPYSLYFDKQLTPNAQLWPIPSVTEDYVIHYDGLTVFNDFKIGTDTPLSTSNFPNRWLRYFIYALASELSEYYQINQTKILRLSARAKELKEAAIRRDHSNEDMTFTEPAFY